jgi:hypothetical protein
VGVSLSGPHSSRWLGEELTAKVLACAGFGESRSGAPCEVACPRPRVLTPRVRIGLEERKPIHSCLWRSLSPPWHHRDNSKRASVANVTLRRRVSTGLQSPILTSLARTAPSPLGLGTMRHLGSEHLLSYHEPTGLPCRSTLRSSSVSTRSTKLRAPVRSASLHVTPSKVPWLLPS